ncbi:hypothetical protein [Noviherbaspirillum aerium]|uniref:hypothetical protein n=1 Tax=Noviherbaspirillum aerium TaxID=2588497 RepID=UPI00124E4753|nr:hypothetical protein [Noviherbaspirillum aerium]
MQLSMPGSFPHGPTISSRNIDFSEGRGSSNSRHDSASGSTAPSATASPEARPGTGREVALHKKLIASLSGNLAVTLPMTAIDVATSAASAAVRRENVATGASHAALAGGMGLLSGLHLSAATTGLLHYTGLASRIWSQPSTENEVLDRTFLISAMLNTGNGILGGMAYDIATKAIMRHEINREALLETLINQVISKAVAAGIIRVGAVKLYKHNQRFRDVVNNSLITVLNELRSRTGHLGPAHAGLTQENLQSAMEEGRTAGDSEAAAMEEGRASRGSTASAVVENQTPDGSAQAVIEGNGVSVNLEETARPQA